MRSFYQTAFKTLNLLKSARLILTLAFIAIIGAANAQSVTVSTTVDENNGNTTNIAALIGTPGGAGISIREAVLAANNEPNGATIIITIPAGTYNLSLFTAGETSTLYNAASGDLDILAATVGATNKTLTINGAGTATTIINQTLAGERIMEVHAGAAASFPGSITFSITGITFTGGSPATSSGGAILAGRPGDVTTVTNCIFSNNVSSNAGGALSVSSGGASHNLIVTGCTFSNNTSNGSGAAISFNGNGTSTITIDQNTFTNNTSTASNGGAINISGTSPGPNLCNITRNTFTGNTANVGGAAINATNVVTINANYNRIVGNNSTAATGKMILGTGGVITTFNKDNNWWGVNTGPAAADISDVTATPAANWLQLKSSASPASISVGATSFVTSGFLSNSATSAVSVANLTPEMIGLPISFTSILGTLSGAQPAIQASGTATVTYTATGNGAGSVNAVVDNVPAADLTARANITVTCAAVDQTVTASPTSVCAGGSSTITVGASQPGVNYTLRIDPVNTIVAGPTASNGPAINFSTGPIASTTTYNVLAETDKYSVNLTGGQSGFLIPANANLNFTDNFTVEGWIKPAGNGGFARMFNKDGCFALGLSSNQTELDFVRHTSGDFTRPFTFVTGTWYHIAATYAGGTVELFVNGVSIGTVAGVPAISGANNPGHIGSDAGGGFNQFNGNIDNVRIWNSVRTQAQIAANQGAFLTSTGNPTLVASWWIIEGAGNAKDYSANAINATALAGTWQVDAPVAPCSIVLTTKPTVTVSTNTITLSSAAGTDAQTVCINTAITNITYNTTGATGATFSGLPAGVTGNWAANVVTISGTPTASGTFNYTVTLTGGCSGGSASGSITVTPLNTVTLTSAAGTNNQTVVINTPITNITYSTTGAIGATFAGLPAGVTGSWAVNVVTISGTPTVAGTFNYTVTLTGGCGTVTATGTITVTTCSITLTSAAGTNAQTICNGSAITNITYTTTAATGATFAGLPAGVTGSWAANVVTISGTPTASGTFNYTVTLTGGGCSNTATGTITVNPIPTVNQPADQVLCNNTATAAVIFSGNLGGTLCGTVLEGGSVTLTAPAGTVITSIIFASYGTPNGSCGNFTIGACHAANSVPVVSGLAIGQNSVTIPANNATFGDPCVGTSKRLYIQATYGATTFSWTNNTPSIGLAASGTGNIASFTATNASTSPVVATVTVTPTYTNITAATFNFTGGMQTFTVPAGITSVTIDAYGAQGGNGAAGTISAGGNGGLGSKSSGTLSVVPGQVLNIFVGGQGTSPTGGFNGGGNAGAANGGGGGGASDVRYPGVTAANRIIVGAGGGGGGRAGCNTAAIGGNGGFGGGNGSNGMDAATPGGFAGGGFGAIGANGGAKGIGCAGFSGINGSTAVNENGAAGGTGQSCCCPSQPGGGGGGGGFLGGGGGGGGSAGTTGCSGNDKGGGGGGAGGSNYTGGLSGSTVVNSAQTGAGKVVITYGVSVTCTGTPKTFTYTVNPTPNATATPSSQTICSGSPIITIVNSGTVPSTVYNWTRDNPVVTGIATSGSGNISGSLTNTTNSPITVTFTVTPSYTNAGVTCTGTPVTATVVVNPIPNVLPVPASQTICSGSAITTIVPTGNVSGTVYNWTRDNTVTVTGIAANGSGNISGSLTNTTAAPITVTFTITPSYTNAGTTCTGTPATSTVVVNPSPNAVATPSSQTICSGSAITTIVNSSSTAGTTFTWTRDNIATVTGIAASGSGNISGSLTNASAAPITVTFTITPSFTNAGTTCTGTAITATVVVNPIPDVNQPASQVVCNNTPTAPVNFTGSVAGTIFNWTNNTTSIGLAASGTGNIASFTALNTGTTPVVAIVTVTPSFISGGGGTSNLILNGDFETGSITGWTNAPSGGATGWNINNGTLIPPGSSSSTPVIAGSFDVVSTQTGPGLNLLSSLITLPASFSSSVLDWKDRIMNYNNGLHPGCSGSPAGYFNPQQQFRVQLLNSSLSLITTVFSTNPGDPYFQVGPNNRSFDVTAVLLPYAGQQVYVRFTQEAQYCYFNVTLDDIKLLVNSGVTCTGSPKTFTITVNPTPTVNPVANQVVCNGSPTAAVTFTGAPSGTVFNWTNSNTTIGLPVASGSGNIASFVGVNNGTAPAVATITVTPSYTNAGVTCTGTPITFTYTVNPTPSVNQPANQVVCNNAPTAAVNFTSPNTGGTLTYNWTNNTTSIGLAASGTGDIASFTATNATNAPVVATITVTPTYTNGGVSCVGPSKTFTITVNPTPVVNPVANQVVCNNTPTAAVNFSSPTTGGTIIYNWTNNTASIGLATSGSGNIPSFTALNATNAPVVATISVTASYTNGGVTCVGPAVTFTITVNPTPTAVATPSSQTICSGSAITPIVLSPGGSGNLVVGLNFSSTWADEISIQLVDASNVTVLAAGPFGGFSTYTSAPIPAVNGPYTFNIAAGSSIGDNYSAWNISCNATSIANGCIRGPVGPACGSTSFLSVPGLSCGGGVAGTTYTWTRDNTATVTGIPASGSGSPISGTLTNTTNAPITVTFTITPSANGCPGTPIIATVVVNPIPNAVATPSAQTICTGSAITTIVLSGNVASTVYNWTRDNTGTVTGIAASGTGNISGTLTNTTNAPVTVTFTITPTYTNGGVTCTGPSITATVVVNPIPNAVATPPSQTICNGTAITTIVLSGNVAGTVFNWTRNNLGVTGIAASGTGNISGTLTNTTNAPVTVTFTITPTYTNGGVTCTGTPITATVTVNPTAIVNPIPNQVVCNGGLTAPVNFTSPTTGGTIVFNWTNTQASIGLAASGTGNISAFTATNATNAPVVAIVTVTPVFGGSVTYNFTNCTATGITGPSQAQVNAAYTATPLAGQVTVTGQGIQQWTVPTTGLYTLTSAGASGGFTPQAIGGRGRIITTQVNLTAGDVINILVGQEGGRAEFSSPGYTGGGGGGTFIINQTTNTPILISGGGGGAGQGNASWGSPILNGIDASPYNVTSGGNGIGYAQSWSVIGIGGTSGSGGTKPGFGGAGGGGYIGNGQGGSSYAGNPGLSYGNGGLGGINLNYAGGTTVNIPGGFGGGAGAGTHSNYEANGGGGGGYSGGGGSNTRVGAGGGGGNLFTGTFVSSGLNTGNGYVTLVLGAGISCPGTPRIFTYTVNPTATVNTVPNQVVCNNTSTAQVIFSSQTTGGSIVYNWTNNTTSIGLAASGTGNIASFVATNATNAPVTATITVTPIYTSGGVSCVGTPTSFTITVNPTPIVIVTPSRNQVVCNGDPTDPVIFSSPTTGGTIVYNWTNTGAFIGLGPNGVGNIPSFIATNPGTIPLTATITVIATYTNGGVSCISAPVTFTITVNPTPTVAQPANQTVCNGSPTAPVNFTGTVPGTVFSWTNNNTSIGLAASGNGNIPSFIGINTGTTPQVATITVYPTYTNGGVTCTGAIKTFTITVNPMPTVNTQANQTVCAGTLTTANFTGSVPGTVYNWINNNTAIGLGASGTGNIAFISTNATAAPIVATITVTPTYTNGGTTCTGSPISFTVIVNPIPTVNPVVNQVRCNGSATAAVNFTSPVSGTVFNWTNNTTSIGLAASGTGNIASFIATNVTNAPVTATITVTASFTNGGVTCTGTPITFTITVNPTPSVNAIANQVVCNGATTTAVTITGPVAGTVYNWTNNNTSIGLTASGTGNIAAFTAINNTNAPVTATITVTPIYTNGGVSCSGPSISFTITVNPTASVNQPANQLLCNGSATTAVNFTGGVAGTTYSWTNSNTAIGLAASGTGNIASFTATNATGAPISATITVTPSAAGCVGTPVSFTITVNPTPTVNQPANQTLCAGATTTAVVFTGSVAGTVYTWTNNNTTIGLGASGTGIVPAFVTINPTTLPITATITVTPTYLNGGVTCTGASVSFTITVNPSPSIIFGNIPARVCLTDTVVILRVTPAGGTWAGRGVTGSTFSATAAGTGVHTLTYTFTNTNGCTVSSYVNVMVNDCIERHNVFATAIRIYPNPSSGRFNIRFLSDIYTEFKVKVVDAAGREYRSYSFTGLRYGSVIPMNLSELAAGAYFLQIYNDLERASFPIVIVR